MRQLRSPWLAFLVRVIYALCLAVGTYNHALVVFRHGWHWNYGGKPLGAVIFWTATTLFDPLVALLLLLRPKLGVILLLLLMASDVALNISISVLYGDMMVWMVGNQCIFFAFVLSTMSLAWPKACSAE